jgi:hypothetical protein
VNRQSYSLAMSNQFMSAVSLSAHLVLAAPFVVLTAFIAVIAVTWRNTGDSGPTTEMMYGLLLLFGVPTAAYLWLIQRWWRNGPWLALTIMDGALVVLGALLVTTADDGQELLLVGSLIALSGTATLTLIVLARRGRGSSWGPIQSPKLDEVW